MHWIRYILLAVVLVAFTACIREKGCTDPSALNYNPDAFKEDNSCIYELDTLAELSTYQFGRGWLSSTQYNVPIVRNLLLQDLAHHITKLATTAASPLATAALLNLYDSPAISLEITTTTEPYTINPATYGAIASLTDLEAAVDDTYQADSLILAAISIIEANSLDPSLLASPAVYTDVSGLDLQQLIYTTLMGSVCYAQASILLTNIRQNNNKNIIANDEFAYTTRENAWDLAFGYFGAARDYASYSDEDLTSEQPYKDSDSDGSITFESEYNFNFAQVAAQVDQDGLLPIISDVNQQIFDDFLQGRVLIANTVNDDDTDSLNTILPLEAYANNIILNWELIIAAKSIEQLNFLKTALNELAAGATVEEAILNAHWTATKGWIGALRYNPQNRLNQADSLLHLMGEVPIHDPIDAPSYIETLEGILDEIKLTFGF